MPSSVCVDAGTATGAPNVDFNGNVRIDGSIDMGCYEDPKTPVIYTTSSFADFESCVGTPGEEQIFQVSGYHLNGDLLRFHLRVMKFQQYQVVLSLVV